MPSAFCTISVFIVLFILLFKSFHWRVKEASLRSRILYMFYLSSNTNHEIELGQGFAQYTAVLGSTRSRLGEALNYTGSKAVVKNYTTRSNKT